MKKKEKYVDFAQHYMLYEIQVQSENEPNNTQNLH